MKEPIFTGTCTALVTPFLNGKVNYPLLEVLLRRQIDAGIHSVVLCGTTGESPTLSDNEKLEIIHRSKAFAGNQLTIIAGTGSNDTAHTISLSKAAAEVGADGLLIVTPYYNKATPDGLYKHYTAIAKNVKIPIILYNVPTRTGVDIPISVYRELADLPNIIGVKEAAADITKIVRIRHYCPGDFHIWSGNDDMTVPILSVGGQGVISVLSNLYPNYVAEMTTAALHGDYTKAGQLQVRLSPLLKALFHEVNPIPIKAAMQLTGFDCGSCRMPLTSASDETLQLLREAML